MIRDKNVVGVRDSKLLERLQLDPDLSLVRAVLQVRRTEAVKSQVIVAWKTRHPCGGGPENKGRAEVQRQSEV